MQYGKYFKFFIILRNQCHTHLKKKSNTEIRRPPYYLFLLVYTYMFIKNIHMLRLLTLSNTDTYLFAFFYNKMYWSLISAFVYHHPSPHPHNVIMIFFLLHVIHCLENLLGRTKYLSRLCWLWTRREPMLKLAFH